MKKYFLINKPLFFTIVTFMFLLPLGDVSIAYLSKAIIDATINRNFNLFPTLITSIALISVFVVFIEYLRKLLTAKLVKSILVKLKSDVFFKLMNRNPKNFYSTNSSEYISILNNDISMIENEYFQGYLFFIYTIFCVVISIVAMININVYLSLTIILCNLIVLLIPKLFENKISILRKSYSNNTGFFIGKIKDMFSAYEIIKSYNVTDKANIEFNKATENHEGSKYNFFKCTFRLEGSMAFIMYVQKFLLLGIGLLLVMKGLSTVGTFVAALQLMDMLLGPVLGISHRLLGLKSIKLIVKKVEDILAENTLESYSVENHSFVNNISFRNCSYGYEENHKTLKNISFKLDKNKKYAIVGKSGAGKSTVFKLLLRYYDNYEGEILLDDIDIRSFKSKTIYDLMAIIHQNVFVFNTTLRNNITLYKDFSDEEVLKVIDLLGLNDLLKRLDNNLHSEIKENGINLSGGEKQRISIARALMKKTPILLLDEATSSIDNENSFNIENSLLKIDNLTLISIKHNLSKEILSMYDEIIVMEDGSIVEHGSFHDLLSREKYFYKLYNSNI